MIPPARSFVWTKPARNYTPRGSLPLQTAQPVRQDDAYERRGVVNLLLAIEPLRGWRKGRVADRRTKRDVAEQLRQLAEEDDPHARRIVLVVDNLNTHGPGALSEAFAPEEAHRLAARFEWHYTPEHGSWLNIAECELSVRATQCLDRRIPDKQTLIREVAAWEEASQPGSRQGGMAVHHCRCPHQAQATLSGYKRTESNLTRH